MKLREGRILVEQPREAKPRDTRRSLLRGMWIERFARHWRTNDLQTKGAAEIRAFLDNLALDQRLSASSQRQALNALVFLFREVFEKELGDFSDFRRARVRPHLPVWLTREELKQLLDCLEPLWALMARVMYGGGLRLMELLRLRVKDVDLDQEIIAVRGGKGDKDRFVPLAHSVVLGCPWSPFPWRVAEISIDLR